MTPERQPEIRPYRTDEEKLAARATQELDPEAEARFDRLVVAARRKRSYRRRVQAVAGAGVGLAVAAAVAYLVLTPASVLGLLQDGEAHLAAERLSEAAQACGQAAEQGGGEERVRALLCVARVKIRQKLNPEETRPHLAAALKAAHDLNSESDLLIIEAELASMHFEASQSNWPAVLSVAKHVKVARPAEIAEGAGLLSQAYLALGDVQSLAMTCTQLPEDNQAACNAQLACQIGAGPCAEGAAGLSARAAKGLDDLLGSFDKRAARTYAETQANPSTHAGAALHEALLGAQLKGQAQDWQGAADTLWPAVERAERELYTPWPKVSSTRAAHLRAYEYLLEALARSGQADKAARIMRLIKSREGRKPLADPKGWFAQHLPREGTGIPGLGLMPADVALVDVYMPASPYLGVGVWRSTQGARAGVIRLSRRQITPLIEDALRLSREGRPDVAKVLKSLNWTIVRPIMGDEPPTGLTSLYVLGHNPITSKLVELLTWAPGLQVLKHDQQPPTPVSLGPLESLVTFSRQ